MKRSVIVTGALGGIGSSICSVFKENGFFVVGIDKLAKEKPHSCDELLTFDLSRFPHDRVYQQECLSQLGLVANNLLVLINNAAVQIIDSFDKICIEDWQHTLDINLTAPMLLSQWSLPFLEKNKGCIINIASIHHQLTKKEFVSYAI